MTDQSVEDQDDGDEPDALSLDDLGAAYAKAAAKYDPEAFATKSIDDGDADHANATRESEAVDAPAIDDEQNDVVTPHAIIEAALFVGHPQQRSTTPERLASLMRDVTAPEVVAMIDELNASYREVGQALRIISEDGGYRMTIAPEVEDTRRAFLGKVREARLTQGAIEVLSLVAYQPGVSAQTIQDQRGKESGALLNQLVRRQLLRLERVKPAEGGRASSHYFPTERFLVLFGLESLDDLPQVEESLRN